MKKIILILVILGSLAVAAGCVIGLGARNVTNIKNSDKGSGKIATTTMPAPQFHSINASRAVKVVISDQISDQIRIDADDNIIDHVVVKNEEDELDITIDKLLTFSNINVTVTVPANGTIRSLEASSAAQISSNIPLSAPQFTIDASSAARITATITATRCTIETSSAAKVIATLEVEECEVNMSSASKVELTGVAKMLRAELSSASKLSAEALSATKATIKTSSAAKAMVTCSETLHAEASSGSSIGYTGDCQVSTHTSSGGNIRRN